MTPTLLSQKCRYRCAFGTAVFLIVGACSSATTPGPIDTPEEILPIPAVGTAETLDIATWNLEWFGDGANGPNNDVRQQENIRSAMAALEIDLWAVQEVVSPAAFAALVNGLEGWEGVLANDPAVEDGPAFYSDFGGNEQKVGVIYRSGLLELTGASVILGEFEYEFAGRPPLEVRFRLAGSDATLRVIVFHAKAGATEGDRIRRADAAAALKSLVDQAYPADAVLLIGDFNDDLDRSIVDGSDTPYAGFRADSASYFLPTLALSEAGTASMVRYPDPVDHHIVTDELQPWYVAGSAQVIRLDQWITGYGDTTSDHYPTVTRFQVN